MNLIGFLLENSDLKILIISNKLNPAINFNTYKHASNRIKILRPSIIHCNILCRIYNYIKFYLFSFYYLIIYNPKIVLYFETLSSLPAIMFKKIKKKKISLMCHYHEYTTTAEYKNGMFLNKWIHEIEKKNYHNYQWISQTNKERLSRFLIDINQPFIRKVIFKVMPNYPSKKWVSNTDKKLHSLLELKFIFIGSLCLKNHYLKEMADFAIKNKIQFDIFSHNIKEDAIDYIKNLQSTYVKYCGIIDYDSIRDTLKDYNIGVVLYHPTTSNVKYSAPNKIFEYLSCGLDVLIPDNMEYAMNYVNQSYRPRIIPINFNQLDSFDYASYVNNNDLSYKPSPYNYEDVYQVLLTNILQFQQNSN